MMKIDILSLFPEMFEGFLNTSIIKRAIDKEVVDIKIHNFREFTQDKHKHVDDYPYGGGAGMVMQPEPIYLAYEDVTQNMEKKPRVVYVTPQGSVFNQSMAEEFSKEEDLILLCGHYEGIDERVIEEIVTDPVSIGDFVLTGGELPAMMIVDAVSRLVPGVLGNGVSAETDSFQDGLLEYPQYSRPEEWNGRKVPDILLSGDHAKVDAWRLEQSLLRTKAIRPDLYEAWKNAHPEEPPKKKRKKTCMS